MEPSARTRGCHQTSGALLHCVSAAALAQRPREAVGFPLGDLQTHRMCSWAPILLALLQQGLDQMGPDLHSNINHSVLLQHNTTCCVWLNLAIHKQVSSSSCSVPSLWDHTASYDPTLFQSRSTLKQC